MDQMARMRRLRIRSWRRGTREMDLLLGRFADANLATFDADGVELFEALLDEDDPLVADLVFGFKPGGRLAPIADAIRQFHSINIEGEQ